MAAGPSDEPPHTQEGINRNRVGTLAELSHLALTNEELERVTRDLEQILHYVEILQAVDTKGVPPTTHAVELTTAYREDAAHNPMNVRTALQNAPEPIGEGFGVPRIIE